MKYCQKCGANNSDDAVFCTSCGSRLEKTGIQPEQQRRRSAIRWLLPVLFAVLCIAVFLVYKNLRAPESQKQEAWKEKISFSELSYENGRIEGYADNATEHELKAVITVDAENGDIDQQFTTTIYLEPDEIKKFSADAEDVSDDFQFRVSNVEITEMKTLTERNFQDGDTVTSEEARAYFSEINTEQFAVDAMLFSDQVDLQEMLSKEATYVISGEDASLQYDAQYTAGDCTIDTMQSYRLSDGKMILLVIGFETESRTAVEMVDEHLAAALNFVQWDGSTISSELKKLRDSTTDSDVVSLGTAEIFVTRDTDDEDEDHRWDLYYLMIDVSED